MGNCIPCEQAKKGITKTTNIVKAWKNVIISNPEVEALAEERMKICTPCTNKSEILKVNGNPVYKCNSCGCPLIALVRSDEKCKLNKW